MRRYTGVLLLLVASVAAGQVTVVTTSPDHNTTGVPLTTTIVITFSGAVDTTLGFLPGEHYFTNVITVLEHWWSADSRTVSLSVTLEPSEVYFLMIHSVRPVAGGGFPLPHCFYWTTGTSFPSGVHSISGTVTGGSTGVSPEHTVIGLGAIPFNGSDPEFVGGAVADGLGQFTIPYVPDGTWYPLAAKDADLDGIIDPGSGDPLAFGDSVTVNGANVGGVVLQLRTFGAIRFDDARSEITAMAASVLPPNRELRQLYAWGVDSTGAATEFGGIYTIPGSSVVTEIRLEAFGSQPESTSFTDPWVWGWRPYAGLAGAALLDSVVARAERMGGREFRRQAPPVPGSRFTAYARLGALHNTEFGWAISDTSQDYWGLQYSFQVQVTQESSYTVAWKLFLASATTGEIIVVTAVEDKQATTPPNSYSLGENFPNPFNPATTITYALPTQSRVSIEVFNLLGQRVTTLVDDIQSAGSHQAVWDAQVSSGVYFYRMEAAGVDAPSRRFTQVRKMILTR